ncbi:E3 ubiquitin-protein ligase RNF103-like [Haliotis cracherodii]|uniref:E3 ubiquitin-protein ligase RNF103-like n=1 Tax=Haliotis cracherodii TaxID=6455 RepID=UPI0039E7E347
MWLKLCLLLIYIVVLFILARMLEAISWYETGSLSKRLLDPMTLSVMKLKALLEQRGVGFEGVVLEKSDLTELVEGSGPVTDEEVVSAAREEDSSSVTNFTSGAHFFEQVEDAKDSVWLIQVHNQHGTPVLLGDSRWKSIRKKVSRFGVRAGILDCSLDMRYCLSKGWHTPRLLLALPGEFEAKSNVHIHTYGGPTKTNLLYNWIREKLDGKVEKITHTKQFAEEWYQFKDPFLNPEIRTVYFTNQKNIPMFYSALSVKFPGRVKFGMVDTGSSGGKEVMKYMVMRNRTKAAIPSYMIITAEKNVLYGTRNGENLSFPAMENYFKTLYPCLNDIFIVSFIMTNVLSIFELCLVQGTIYKRLKRFLWYFVKCNVILIMLWLPIVGIFQLPHLDKVPLWLLKCLRMFSTTNMAAHMRKDLSFYTFHSTVLTSVFIAYTILVGFIEYKRKGGEDEAEQEDENFWNFAEMRTLEHLIRPVDPFSGRLQPSELGMNFFGGRLFNPVRPVISLTYIPDLPRWRCKLPSSIDDTCKVCDCCKPIDCPDKEIEKETQNDSVAKNCSEGTLDNYTVAPNVSSPPSLDNLTNQHPSHPEKTLTCTCKLSGPDKSLIDPYYPEGFLPATQCVICLDDYRFGVMLCGLPCLHTFHEDCIVRWLNKGHHYCPMCRWPAYKLKAEMHLLSE